MAHVFVESNKISSSLDSSYHLPALQEVVILELQWPFVRKKFNNSTIAWMLLNVLKCHARLPYENVNIVIQVIAILVDGVISYFAEYLCLLNVNAFACFWKRSSCGLLSFKIHCGVDSFIDLM